MTKKKRRKEKRTLFGQETGLKEDKKTRSSNQHTAFEIPLQSVERFVMLIHIGRGGCMQGEKRKEKNRS